MLLSVINLTRLYFFKEILNLKGHQNRITGSRVTDSGMKLVGGGSVINGDYQSSFIVPNPELGRPAGGTINLVSILYT